MTKVDGAYDCVTKTPFGEQKSVLTIVSDGNRFHGTNAAMLGSLDVENGVIDGDRLTWTMKMTLPMAMQLEAEAFIEDDRLMGTITAPNMGTVPFSGKRRA